MGHRLGLGWRLERLGLGRSELRRVIRPLGMARLGFGSLLLRARLRRRGLCRRLHLRCTRLVAATRARLRPANAKRSRSRPYAKRFRLLVIAERFALWKRFRLLVIVERFALWNRFRPTLPPAWNCVPALAPGACAFT